MVLSIGRLDFAKLNRGQGEKRIQKLRLRGVFSQRLSIPLNLITVFVEIKIGDLRHPSFNQKAVTDKGEESSILSVQSDLKGDLRFQSIPQRSQDLLAVETGILDGAVYSLPPEGRLQAGFLGGGKRRSQKKHKH